MKRTREEEIIEKEKEGEWLVIGHRNQTDEGWWYKFVQDGILEQPWSYEWYKWKNGKWEEQITKKKEKDRRPNLLTKDQMNRYSCPLKLSTEAEVDCHIALHPKKPRIFISKLRETGPQELAFRYAKQTNQEVFGFDMPLRPGPKKGCKGYLVVQDADTLWETFVHFIPVEYRNFYLLIPENHEVGLYVDVEFSKVLNPNLEEHQVRDGAFKYLAEAFPNFNSQYAKLLNSSDKEKGSLHITCDNVTFQNNHSELYAMMKILTQQIRDDYNAGKSRAQSLMALNEKKELIPVIDDTVYTRNRLWRLGGQCKIGAKHRPLKHWPLSDSEEEITGKALFIMSLVHIGQETTQPTETTIGARPSTSGGKRARISNERTSEVPDEYKWAVDAAKKKVLEKNPDGYVNQERYCAEKQYIYVSFANATHCERRTHSSNNVYVMVFLNSQDMVLCCHDDECKKEKSPRICLLPPVENFDLVEYPAAEDWMDSEDVQEVADDSSVSATFSSDDGMPLLKRYATRLVNKVHPRGYSICNWKYDPTKGHVSFGVNNGTYKPACPIYHVATNRVNVEQGCALEYTINLAHDIVPFEGSSSQGTNKWKLQLRVTDCSCRQNRAHICHSDIRLDGVLCEEYDSAELEQLHMSAIRKEAVQNLIPAKWRAEVESGQIDIVPLDQKLLPKPEVGIKLGDVYICSPTGSGKTVMIETLLKQIHCEKLIQFLMLFRFDELCQGAVLGKDIEDKVIVGADWAGLEQDLSKYMKVQPLAMEATSNRQISWVRDKRISWFRDVVLKQLLNLTFKDDGTLDVASLKNLSTCGVSRVLDSASVLFLSPLLTIAGAFEKRFNAVSYQRFFQKHGSEETFARLIKAICSLESITKYKRAKLGTLVADEGRTLLARATGKTMKRDGMQSLRLQLAFRRIEKADRVIVADHELSLHIMKLFLDKRPPSSNNPAIKVYYNVYRGNRCKVYMSNDLGNKGLFDMVRHLAEHNNAAKPEKVVPVVFSVNYNNIGRRIKRILRRYDKGGTVLFINENNKFKPRQQAALADPTNEWVKYRYVIYSPVVQAALDHNPEKPHFRLLVGQMGHGKHGLAENFIQMMGRVRTLQTAFIFAPSVLPYLKANKKLCVERDKIIANVRSNAEAEKELRNNGLVQHYEIVFNEETYLEEHKPVYDEFEMELYVQNVILERLTSNNPRKRLKYLLRKAGHSMEQIQKHDLQFVISSVLECSCQSCTRIIDDKDNPCSKSRKLKTEQEIEEILRTELSDFDRKELQDNRIVDKQVLTDEERKKRKRYKIEQLLSTSDSNCLRYGIKFAMSFDSWTKRYLFKLCCRDPEDNLVHNWSCRDVANEKYEINRKNHLLAQEILQKILKLYGFMSVVDENHIICAAGISLHDISTYLESRRVCISEHPLLQNMGLLDPPTDPERAVQLIKSVFRWMGLRLAKMKRSYGVHENPGYQLDHLSLKCMWDIHKRRFPDIPIYRISISQKSGWEHLFPNGHNFFPEITEGTWPRRFLLETVRDYDPRPFGIRLSSSHPDHPGYAIYIIADKKCYRCVDNEELQSVLNIDVLLDHMRGYAENHGGKDRCRYQCFGEKNREEQDIHEKFKSLYAGIMERQVPGLVQIFHKENLLVVDWRELCSHHGLIIPQDMDILESLNKYRDPSTGNITVWSGNKWTEYRSFYFKECMCSKIDPKKKTCPKKCKREKSRLLCFRMELFGLEP